MSTGRSVSSATSRRRANDLFVAEIPEPTVVRLKRLDVCCGIAQSFAPCHPLDEHVPQNHHVPVHRRWLDDRSPLGDIRVDAEWGDVAQLVLTERLAQQMDAAFGGDIAAMVRLRPLKIERGEFVEGTVWDLFLIEILPLGNLHLALLQHRVSQLLIQADALALAMAVDVVINISDFIPDYRREVIKSDLPALLLEPHSGSSTPNWKEADPLH
jgi:hypothetical protein